MENNEEHINKEILIVEDELDICYLLKVILKKRSLASNCVRSLSEARKYLSSRFPDILFLDNHLPDGFGIDFIPVVKKEYPHIKIIMITAHDTNDDRMQAKALGVDFFIGKPFTSENILDTLTALHV